MYAEEIVSKIEYFCKSKLQLSKSGFISLMEVSKKQFLTQILGKRWKLDLHSHQEASLMLSAVNLPGGVQV